MTATLGHGLPEDRVLAVEPLAALPRDPLAERGPQRVRVLVAALGAVEELARRPLGRAHYLLQRPPMRVGDDRQRHVSVGAAIDPRQPPEAPHGQARAIAAVLGFGIFLDKVIKFWAAQATVATVRNPFLVDTLYQKELLSLLYVQAPMLRALRTLVGDRGSSLSHSAEVLSELDSALTKVATTIADRRWTVKPGERVY